MGPNGPRFEFIYLVSTDYEGRIGSRFTFVHKGVLVTMQDCIGVSELKTHLTLMNRVIKGYEFRVGTIGTHRSIGSLIMKF